MSNPNTIPYIYPSPEVSQALQTHQPVVALESTLIAHGLPRPQNLHTAIQLEALVRTNGAVPATIAIMDGRIRVGLEATDLQRLAEAEDVAKVSRADIAATLATGKMGATTVAATMIAAQMAGIAIFATGGIGGVHRGAAQSFDISADVAELSRTPVAVVCAGAKTILDLPKTVEILETAGVPVIGFGTDQFPGFYCADTGLSVHHRMDTPEALATFLDIHFSLPAHGGVLIGNPVTPDLALNSATVEAAIQSALAEPAAKGLSGKAVTPYLLQRLFALTDGDSLKTNVALIQNNVALAAQLAVTYQALTQARRSLQKPRARYGYS